MCMYFMLKVVMFNHMNMLSIQKNEKITQIFIRKFKGNTKSGSSWNFGMQVTEDTVGMLWTQKFRPMGASPHWREGDMNEGRSPSCHRLQDCQQCFA